MPNEPIDLTVSLPQFSPPTLAEQTANFDPPDPPPGIDIGQQFIDDPTGLYHMIRVSVLFARDYGLSMAPTAGPPGTPCVFWRRSGGLAYKIVEWSLERLGSPPNPPSSAPANQNEILMASFITPDTPGQLPDGQQIFRLSGRYVYGLQVPYADTDPVPYPNTNQIRVQGVTTLILPSTFDLSTIGTYPPPAAFTQQQLGQIGF